MPPRSPITFSTGQTVCDTQYGEIGRIVDSNLERLNGQLARIYTIRWADRSSSRFTESTMRAQFVPA